MIMRPSFITRLGRDSSGATIVEFALLSPVMLMLMMAALDLGHTLYMTSVLQGAVQKAARDSSLETGMSETNQDNIDNWVGKQVRTLRPGATVTFTRRAFHSFTAASTPLEPYTDTNKNGKCDNSEPFVDDNNNKVRDRAGIDGSGGAKDTVLYTATVSYRRLFPVHSLAKAFWPVQSSALTDTVTMEASTILNNQPFGDQGQSSIGHCK